MSNKDKKMAKVILAILLLVATPGISENSIDDGEILTFDIAANTAACVGVAPMRCLVVNGDLFYDAIQGYEHLQGQGSQICVIRTTRPEPVPADIGRFSYHRVDCE